MYNIYIYIYIYYTYICTYSIQLLLQRNAMVEARAHAA